MDFYSQPTVMNPFYGQASPPQPLQPVPPSLSFPLITEPLVLKQPCPPLPLTMPCPPVLDLPAKLFHTLNQPPFTHTDDDCVTTCAHCHRVNTLLDLRMKELIQRCKDEAELISYLRKQIHFRRIPGSEFTVPVSSNLSYQHVHDLCKSSNFNVDADEFRPSQVSALRWLRFLFFLFFQ